MQKVKDAIDRLNNALDGLSSSTTSTQNNPNQNIFQSPNSHPSPNLHPSPQHQRILQDFNKQFPALNAGGSRYRPQAKKPRLSNNFIKDTWTHKFCALSYKDTSVSPNELHLFCLHYVFIPRINAHFQRFILGYDHHPIRTERNLSPLQLWERGLLLQRRPSEDDIVDDCDSYGIDWSVPSHYIETRDDAIVVPEINHPFQSNDLYLEFCRSNDPMANCDNFGIEVFLRTVQVVESTLL
ncbi:uncharacterized protein LOC130621576 [Hydractinia symbiolongicarpus]|uniref:uncharacterized protein LOC130621576 n=1 Tax=Hydractinia symbiolongicarpus TaxID=13093 RepID=UPI00254FC5D7|nr:uncharacterized protein LOC130621576 [Hydractinia symbiolongicarpus]